MGLLSIFGLGTKNKNSSGLNPELEERFQMYLRMIRMTESQIPHQSGHSERVTEYTRLLVARMGIEDDEASRIIRAAQLHDVGKVGLSGLVLGADGDLNGYQVAELRRHPVKGAEMLQSLPHAEHIVHGVLYHHERWDGSGYPEGLKGQEIPLVARVIAVADVFEALTSQRAYRKAYAVENALEHFKNNSGTLYDPEIVSALVEQWSNEPALTGQDWNNEYVESAVQPATPVSGPTPTAESA